MAKCIFDNLSPEQAKVLAEWFEGEGEQSCETWFDENNVPPPLTDIRHKGGYLEILDNGDVIVHCKTP